MGICEYTGDKSIVYTTKSLLDKIPGSKSTNFYFSTQPLFKLDADCLLILSKDYNSIKNNRFIRSIRNKTTASSICQQFVKSCKENKPEFGSMIIFSLCASNLQFSKFAVLCISEKQFQQYYEKGASERSSLQQKLEQNISRLVEENTKSIAVTELQWKSWVSKLSIFKSLTKIIVDKNSFKSVVFACMNEETQNLYMKTVQQTVHESRKR